MGDLASCDWHAEAGGVRGREAGDFDPGGGSMGLARRLTQAAGAGREVGSFDAAGGVATYGWPEG